jgi:DinB superfamily
MGTRVENARGILAYARLLFTNNVQSLTVDEALFAAGGYRSILGVLKHVGGWVHVYWSYAFEPTPKHWDRTSWPRDLRDTVDSSPEYLREVIAWMDDGLQAWDDALAAVEDDDLDRPRPLHWGGTASLGQIVVMVDHEVMYHTGELNMLLSISRGEAWEYTEEVEENHISTFGHGVRASWMSDEQAYRHEEALRIARTTHGAQVAPRATESSSPAFFARSRAFWTGTRRLQPPCGRC